MLGRQKNITLHFVEERSSTEWSKEHEWVVIIGNLFDLTSIEVTLLNATNAHEKKTQQNSFRVWKNDANKCELFHLSAGYQEMSWHWSCDVIVHFSVLIDNSTDKSMELYRKMHGT